jgi:signal-transduction protein with cAMP-binding, CBS, and nucleotidyltransferase domain
MEGFKKYLTEYSSGSTVYVGGEEQTNFYIINKGKVQLTSNADFVLAILTKGDFFGEESLIESQNAKYTVIAIDDTTVIKIPYDQLTEMLKKSSDIALKILKKLSEKNLKIIDTVLKYTDGNAVTGNVAKVDSKDKTTPPSAPDEEINENDSDTGQILGKDVKAYLIVQRSNRIVQLEKHSTFIGRRDFTTGFVPDIDLTKEDEEKYISRKHALITYLGGKFYFSEEPGAVNGTFLNGNKINTGVKYEINNEDKLTLCHIDITFKY